MKQSTWLALLTCVLIAGCSSPSNSNMMEGASQEELDNYDELIAKADAELAGEDEGGDLGE